MGDNTRDNNKLLLILLMAISAITFIINCVIDFNRIYLLLLFFALHVFFIIFAVIFCEAKKTSIIFLIINVLICVAYGCFIKTWFSFLTLLLPLLIIDYVKAKNKNIIALVFPFFIYLITFLPMSFVRRENVAEVFLHLIYIALCSGIIVLGNYFLSRYISNNIELKRILNKIVIEDMSEKELNKQLVIKNYLIDKNARLEERENIGRNIHNSVGHTITASILASDAGMLLYDIDKEKAKKKFEVGAERMKESLSAIRRAVRVLDAEAKEVSISDLAHTLFQSIDNFTKDTEIKIRHNFIVEDDINLPSEDYEFLNGVLLEALANGVKHGNATTFVVLLKYDKRHIMLSISDNGNGIGKMDDAQIQHKLEEGYGLKKIKTYVQNKGGDMLLKNVDGFEIQVTLPIAE